MKKQIGIITRKGLNFTQSSEVISPKSFCWFIFTRAIDMNLDVLFLQNPLNKIYKWRNYLELLLGNSFCGFVLTRAIDMNLDPPFLYNPLRKNEKTIWFITRQRLNSTQGSEVISPNSSCGLHKDHRYELRPAIPVQPSQQECNNKLELLLGNGLNFTQSSEVISPKSFCGFIFTGAIDMNLDVLFLQNPVEQNI